jgi:hypothetical protein
VNGQMPQANGLRLLAKTLEVPVDYLTDEGQDEAPRRLTDVEAMIIKKAHAYGLEASYDALTLLCNGSSVASVKAAADAERRQKDGYSEGTLTIPDSPSNKRKGAS